jgi:hypothetical protein
MQALRRRSSHTTQAAREGAGAYRAELEKCVLVCANCHGEIEAGLLVGPPAGARYQDVLHIYGAEPEDEP